MPDQTSRSRPNIGGQPVDGDAVHGDRIGGGQNGRDQVQVGQVATQAAAIGEGAQASVNHYVQQALSAVEEAERTRLNDLQRLAASVRNYALRLGETATSNGDNGSAGPYRGLVAFTLADA